MFLQVIILVDKQYLRIVLPDNFFLHIVQLDNFFHDDSVEIVACDRNYEGINKQVYDGEDVTDNVDNMMEMTTTTMMTISAGKDIKAGNRGVLCPLLTFGMCAVSFQGPAVGRMIMVIRIVMMMMMMTCPPW